jgi:hypothetical protein
MPATYTSPDGVDAAPDQLWVGTSPFGVVGIGQYQMPSRLPLIAVALGLTAAAPEGAWMAWSCHCGLAQVASLQPHFQAPALLWQT